jgi:fermentation-respiration switch protein FrsA (DUF1100 family)
LLELFSETDQTENLQAISVPVPVMHSDNDAIVPFADSGPLAARLLKNGRLKVYKDLPHGMPTTRTGLVNADLLAAREPRRLLGGNTSARGNASARVTRLQSSQCRVTLMMKAAGTPITAPTKP